MIRYLSTNHGDAALVRRFTDADPMKEPGWANRGNYDKASALMAWLKAGMTEVLYANVTMDTALGLPIEGWSRSYFSEWLYPGRTWRKFGCLTLRNRDGELYAAVGSSAEEVVPLTPLLTRITKKSGANLPASELYVDWPESAPTHRIFFKRITITRKTNGELLLRDAEVIVLEK